MPNKRGGCKTREKAELLLEHIRKDAGNEVVASIEQNLWNNYLINVKFLKKEREISIHTLADWRSYWLCWQEMLLEEE